MFMNYKLKHPQISMKNRYSFFFIQGENTFQGVISQYQQHKFCRENTTTIYMIEQ